MVYRRSWVWRVVVAGLLLVPVVYVGYRICWPFFDHRYEPRGAATAADVAELTSVPPPPGARDFRVATFEHGQARLVFARFSAPVDVCRRYAAAVLPGATLKALTWDQRHDDLGLVSTGSHQLHDLSWFDLPYLRGLWISEDGKAVLPWASTVPDVPDALGVLGAEANTEKEGYSSTAVRVDVGRGVFYFMRAN